MNDIVPVAPNDKPASVDQEWAQILDQLVQELEADNSIPDKVIQATELMLAGWPTYKVAKKLKTTSQTIRGWITKYPTMATVLANGRKLLTKWRMAKLEQQFLTAVERSQEILETGLDGWVYDDDGRPMTKVDAKVLTVIAAQSRYLMGLFAGQKIDIEIRHELGDSVLKAREDALNYLAEQLAHQDTDSDLEPIEAVIKVVDSNPGKSGPVLDEHGQPPFGALGVLDRTGDGSLCHLCGKRFKSLARHIDTEHGATTDEYELTYMLTEGSVRKMDGS